MPGRGRLKYTAVESSPEEDFDSSSMKRRTCTPSCIKAGLFTSVLIGTYYIPSIGLTFYQRWLLQDFQFPLFTVLVHMTVKYLLAVLVRVILARRQRKQRILLNWKDYVKAVAPTGLLSGIDIGFSNWGLELIPISLYSLTKSTTVVFILIFSIIFKLEKKSWNLFGIVSMISVGLMLFTYRSAQFNLVGFILLLVASVASGLRWTCVQLVLQKSKMDMRNPVDMIYHMQPWMIMSILPFMLYSEFPSLIRNCQLFNTKEFSAFITLSLEILLGAFIAFLMELTEVMVVSYTSSLTLAIAGIFKEVFNLGLAVLINGDILSPINVVGLIVCLAGISYHVLHKIKTAPTQRRSFDFTSDRQELREQLIDSELNFDLSSESDGEKSDTQVLFDILNRHDR